MAKKATNIFTLFELCKTLVDNTLNAFLHRHIQGPEVNAELLASRLVAKLNRGALGHALVLVHYVSTEEGNTREGAENLHDGFGVLWFHVELVTGEKPATSEVR